MKHHHIKSTDNQVKMLYMVLSMAIICGAIYTLVRPCFAREQHSTISALEQLIQASQKGDIAIVRKLIASGIDINQKNAAGDSALEMACCRGHLGVCELLLEKGANPNILDSGGTSPITWAIINGKIEIVQMLLNKGVNPNRWDPSSGRPLHVAADLRQEKIVLLLLDRGANIDAQNSHGETPLMIAIQRGDFSTVMILLKHGSRVDLKDEESKTALDYAEKAGNKQIIQTIREELDKERAARGGKPDFFVEPIRAKKAEVFEAAYQKSLSKLNPKQQEKLRDAVNRILDKFDMNVKKRLAALEEKTGGSSSGDKKKYDTLLRIAQDKELFELTGKLKTITINGVPVVPPPLTEEQIRFSLFNGKSPKRIVEDAEGL